MEDRVARRLLEDNLLDRLKRAEGNIALLQKLHTNAGEGGGEGSPDLTIINNTNIGLGAVCFLSETASDIADYKTLSRSWADVESGFSVLSSTPGLGYELIEEFSLPAFDTPVFVNGNFNLDLYLTCSVEQLVYLNAQVYIRDALDNETLLVSRAMSAVLNTSIFNLLFTAPISSGNVFYRVNPTDRFIVKISASVATSVAEVALFFGDAAYPALFAIPYLPSGDVISDAVSSVVGDVPIFSSVDGKHISNSEIPIGALTHSSPALYHLSNTASDVSGYKTLTEIWGEVASGISSAACTAGIMGIIEEFISPELESPTFFTGAFHLGFYLSADVDGDAEVQYEIFTRATGGTETLVIDGSATFSLTGTPQPILFPYSVLFNNAIINPTDRMVLKVSVSVAMDSTVTLQIGSATYPAYVIAPTYKQSLNDISGAGVVGQVAEFVTNTKTLQAAKLIGPAANILIITNAAASTLALNITAAKTLTLTATDNSSIIFTGAGNLTIPTAGNVTAALLGTANVFTTTQTITPATDVVGLILNKPTTVNILQSKNGATVLSGINNLGQYYSGATGAINADFQVTHSAMVDSIAHYGFYANLNSYGVGNLVAARFLATSLRNDTATISLIQAVEFTASLGAGATINVTNMYGVLGAVTHTGNSGTILNAYASQVGIANTSASGIITNAYGYHYINYAGSGIITNLYGLYLSNINRGVTLNYAIYTNLGLNRFGDQLSVVGAVDRNQLKVTGHTTQTLPVGYFIDNTAATAVIRDVLQLETQSTGTAAAGLGAGLLFSIETATASTMQSAGRVYSEWVTAANATRASKTSVTAFDYGAERIGFQVEGSGTATKISLYGGTTVIRGAALTAADASAINTGDATSDTVIGNMRTRINELEARLGSATGINIFA